ncbi:uncharacterized protein LOC120139905 isoform X2 [Hibiscus syriacus]|nr:uncharacterized protein LOC120139905 isoform X2 [Hibiscus syriacus]
MQEVAGERGGYLHGRGALDSDDLLYLKEQMEAEEDAERLLRRTEKRAFAAFKKAASLADSSPASFPLPRRVEPKPKSGIRQHVLLKKVVEVKPKRTKFSSPSDSAPEGNSSNIQSRGQEIVHEKNEHHVSESNTTGKQTRMENPAKSLLGLTYASSDDDDDDD